MYLYYLIEHDEHYQSKTSPNEEMCRAVELGQLEVYRYRKNSFQLLTPEGNWIPLNEGSYDEDRDSDPYSDDPGDAG